MICALKINNIAIIEDIEMELTDGLNILTGETGAGKSIILDALGLVLGDRGLGDFIRTGSDKAVVQAVFDIKGMEDINKALGSVGVEADAEGMLILTRELNRTGRHLCRVNGQIVPLAVLKEIGQQLVDTHSQHEQQSLLAPQRQRELLDRFGGGKLLDLLHSYTSSYSKWQEKVNELAGQKKGAKERLRRIDNLEFQTEEIKRAGLKPGEEEELLRERLLLVNAEKIKILANEAYCSLYESESPGSAAFELLGIAVNRLGELCGLDEKMESLFNTLKGTLYQVEDVARELKGYFDNIEFDPDRLNVIEERLTYIKSLKRKYGNSIEEVLDYYQNAMAELDDLRDHKEHSKMLQTETEKAEKECVSLARHLREARINAAKKLEKMVTRELSDLNMGKVKFEVFLNKKEHISKEGMEDIEFLLSTNPGEPLKPLAKIASGGELSRIILALKAILAGVDSVPTMVFDEVDTGVGGSALQAVAKKIARISKKRQVMCITHAAQVACYADTHYRIDKETASDYTSAHVRLLDRDERINELARMLGGNKLTPLIKKHARELFETSQKTLPFQNRFDK